MNSEISIQLLIILFLVIAVFRASAQDSGYLPDLPGFPSGTYAQVAAVGAKIHGRLSAKEMDPVTGDLKRFIRMTYYGPTDTYARMGICSLYTDPKIVAGYSNPSKEDGRDVLVERRSVKYYRRDGSGGGYSLWYYKAGAVDKLFEYEFQSEDIGMPLPGAVGRPFENLSPSHRLEIQFVPKATIFTLKNEESRRPDDVMGAMLLRLEGAAGAASEEVQGIVELGSLAFEPMKAVGMARNMGQAIVHWDQTMAAIQGQVQDAANTYWESRLGLINPEDAYRKEGAFLFHVASSVTGGWVVKGAGKTVAKLAGKVDDVGSLAAKRSLWSSTKGKTWVENAFEHWQKHGAEFPEFQNANQYVEGAHSFFSSPPAGTLTKTRPNGDTLFYNPGNNTFGVQAADGAPRTMFRPTDGINYWNKQ